MRLAATIIGALLLAGCGSAAEQTGVPGSSTEATASGEGIATTVPDADTDIDESTLKPPPIFLVSAQGKQRAVQGSYCVDFVDPGSGQGQGACADTGVIHPRAVTAVSRGDEVTFVFSGAKVVRPSGCHSDDEQGCIGYVYVSPLGCEDRQIESVPLTLGSETRWRVDLEPGAYELGVFGYFESDAGATGDVSGSLGLTVAGAKENDALGVLAVKPALQVCKFAD
jgi:hypothetical protein